MKKLSENLKSNFRKLNAVPCKFKTCSRISTWKVQNSDQRQFSYRFGILSIIIHQNHQNEKHNGEPAEFKIVVMDKFKDAMSGQLSEALNIKNQAGKTEILNSKAEYHQPQIVRLRKSVQVGL